jgi:hypothetical protein
VLLDPDAFIATAVCDDAGALERQEAAPEVRPAMALFGDALMAPRRREQAGAAWAVYHSTPRPESGTGLGGGAAQRNGERSDDGDDRESGGDDERGGVAGGGVDGRALDELSPRGR